MLSFEELLRQKYDELLQEYRVEDPWHFEGNLYERIRHDAMAEFVLASAPRTITDLGCGEGHFLGRLLARAPAIKATGVELVPEAAARCRARLAQYNVKILTMDLLEYLKAEDTERGRNDVVICGDVLYFMPAPLISEQVVPGVFSLLRSGGAAVISSGDDLEWVHQLFEERFSPVNMVHIKPRLGPPPCAWVVSLQIRRDTA